MLLAWHQQEIWERWEESNVGSGNERYERQWEVNHAGSGVHSKKQQKLSLGEKISGESKACVVIKKNFFFFSVAVEYSESHRDIHRCRYRHGYRYMDTDTDTNIHTNTDTNILIHILIHTDTTTLPYKKPWASQSPSPLWPIEDSTPVAGFYPRLSAGAGLLVVVRNG